MLLGMFEGLDCQFFILQVLVEVLLDIVGLLKICVVMVCVVVVVVVDGCLDFVVGQCLDSFVVCCVVLFGIGLWIVYYIVLCVLVLFDVFFVGDFVLQQVFGGEICFVECVIEVCLYVWCLWCVYVVLYLWYLFFFVFGVCL